jgi:GR25 family glycosyltransferase involved in LPS biosynthesis
MLTAVCALIIICAIILFVQKTNYGVPSSDTKQTRFDEVYLINLKRRVDRLQEFTDHYQKSDMRNISFVRFDAIDGSKLDVDNVPLTELARAELRQLESSGYRNKHYQLTKGAIGCYLSHTKVWENIMKSNHDVVLVMEDDAKIPENFIAMLHESIPHIPSDWDIVLLGYICNSCVKKNRYKEVKRFMLTHCYLIKREAIHKIIGTRTLFPISQQIDAYLSELSSVLNIYTVKTRMVPQFKSRTDIQAPLENKHDKTVNERMRVL